MLILLANRTDQSPYRSSGLAVIRRTNSNTQPSSSHTLRPVSKVTARSVVTRARAGHDSTGRWDKTVSKVTARSVVTRARAGHDSTGRRENTVGKVTARSVATWGRIVLDNGKKSWKKCKLNKPRWPIIISADDNFFCVKYSNVTLPKRFSKLILIPTE